MLETLTSLDTAAFRLLNQTLSNPVFDAVMPFFSGNVVFFPFVILIAIWLLVKGGVRGRVFVFLLLLVISIGDGVVCNTLKHALARPRPFNTILDANLLVGRGGSGSLPSSHAANWFSATMVAFLFYRRSWRFMLPLALTVAFSRVYNGVHYPGDVLAGAILGAGYGFAIVWLANRLWLAVGPKFFPDWWRQLPSLAQPNLTVADFPDVRISSVKSTPEQKYLRAGYFLIGVLLLARLGYLAAGKIELSEDEAYQWHWSKHLALSYYSKPPMIAWLQWLGTHLGGDTTFGVRCLSPVIGAILSWLLLRFLAATAHVRAGLIAVIAINCTPLLAVGATLLTIDPPLILFWMLAMFAGWRAVQPDGKTSQWAQAGFWLGLSFLSKYAALYQLLCWALFFVLWKPARIHLRKPGPYLALLVVAFSLVPVLLWNAQHDWVTLHHVADNAGRVEPWHFTLKYLIDFLGTEAVLLNPVFFLAMLAALGLFWKTRRRDPLSLFFFAMGAPVFVGYLFFAFYKRIFPNWIAPCILPLFCLAILYWEERWRSGARWVKTLFLVGVGFGFFAVVLLHDTNLIGKMTGHYLPAKADPLRRVRGWKETAVVVAEMHAKLAAEGKPAFVIASHYGLTGEMGFYWPEARAGVLKREPLIYAQAGDRPKNQFYFWPEFQYRDHRTGQNAVFFYEEDIEVGPAPYEYAKLALEFKRVEDWGTRDVTYRGRFVRRLHFFAAYGLRAKDKILTMDKLRALMGQMGTNAPALPPP